MKKDGNKTFTMPSENEQNAPEKRTLSLEEKLMYTVVPIGFGLAGLYIEGGGAGAIGGLILGGIVCYADYKNRQRAS